MGESSQEWKNLSPKSNYMMSFMRELQEKLKRMGREHKEGMDSMRKDTQSVNAKVKDLSKRKEENPRVVSLHKSKGSYDEGHYSERSESSRTFKRENREGQKRVERNNREERCERNRRGREDPRKEEHDMGKCKIPPFLSNYKPKVYLDWELKVEKILVWWNQVLEDIRRGRRDPCESWASLKRMMRERFMPSYYTSDLYNELQRLYQGSKSVEEYHKKMEIDLMKAQIEETKEATMARFLHNLNREI
ncbi:hypothetical protein CR513_17340, partial [Mucuna pruriens]